MASSTGYIWEGPQLVSGPRGASGLRDNRHTHRREGGGRGRGSRPANTGVDVWRDGDLEGRQGLPETREHQPGPQHRELPDSTCPPCNFMVRSRRCPSDWKALGYTRMFFSRETHEHPTLRLLSSRLHSFLGTPRSELVYTFASRLNHHGRLTSWLDHQPGTCCRQFPKDVQKPLCIAAQSMWHPQQCSLMSTFKSIKPHSLRPISQG